MARRLEDARILMYSHDTFGLGHLRRCRTIAHALVEDYRGLNILIISGRDDCRRLRLPRPSRFREDPERHQASAAVNIRRSPAISIFRTR